MKVSEVNNRVLQTLTAFEKLDNIEYSPEWNRSLMDKIDTAKHQSTSGFPKMSFTVIMLFVLLINVGFIIKTVLKTSQKSSSHKSELQLISKEILVNPEN